MIKNIVIKIFLKNKIGIFILDLFGKLFLIIRKNEKYLHYKSLIFSLNYKKSDLVLKSGIENSKFTLINEGLYEYKYFNFFFLNNMLSSILYVLSEGYYPIIKLKERQENWTDWDTFFEQPFNCKLNVENLPVCNVKTGNLKFLFTTPYNEVELKVWCKLYKDFVVFNPKTKAYIESEYKKLLYPHKRVLGVLSRGTDYVKLKPKYHPIQPNIEDLIKLSRIKMKELNLEYIYLATEEKKIVDIFEKKFPGKILINERSYYDEIYYKNNLKILDQINFNREKDNYFKGLEYLSSIYLLSKCSALIAGNCGGSCAALYMNNMEFEYWKLFNLGFYGVDEI